MLSDKLLHVSPCRTLIMTISSSSVTISVMNTHLLPITCHVAGTVATMSFSYRPSLRRPSEKKLQTCHCDRSDIVIIWSSIWIKKINGGGCPSVSLIFCLFIFTSHFFNGCLINRVGGFSWGFHCGTQPSMSHLAITFVKAHFPWCFLVVVAVFYQVYRVRCGYYISNADSSTVKTNMF